MQSLRATSGVRAAAPTRSPRLAVPGASSSSRRCAVLARVASAEPATTQRRDERGFALKEVRLASV